MSKPRTVSGELPRGLLFQKGSGSLYVIVPAPKRGDKVVRIPTGIPYQQLATDEERAASVARGSALVQLLTGMGAEPRYHDVLGAIRDRTISMRDVIAVGLTDGRHALKERVDARRAAERDIDLQPFIELFASYRFCLHPSSAKRGKAMRLSTRGQQVSHVRRYLSWAAISAGLSADERGARPMSLLKPVLFAPYPSVIADRTVEDCRKRGEVVDKSTGTRAARDAFGAMAQFRRFLAEHLQLADVPDVTNGLFRPSATNKRDLHITADEVQLLIDELLMAGEREAAVYCAIMHSTALETTDVATMCATQIERGASLWMVHSTSMKTDARHRRVPMYPGSYDFVGAYIDERITADGPSSRLFPAWAEWRNERDPYLRAHQKAASSLVAKGHLAFDGYQPRDSRHTLAVALAKAGVSARIIGLQLGTAESTITRVYAKWLQSAQEWQDTADRLGGSFIPNTAHWARIAARVNPAHAITAPAQSQQPSLQPAFRRRPTASLSAAATATKPD